MMLSMVALLVVLAVASVLWDGHRSRPAPVPARPVPAGRAAGRSGVHRSRADVATDPPTRPAPALRHHGPGAPGAPGPSCSCGGTGFSASRAAAGAAAAGAGRSHPAAAAGTAGPGPAAGPAAPAGCRSRRARSAAAGSACSGPGSRASPLTASSASTRESASRNGLPSSTLIPEVTADTVTLSAATSSGDRARIPTFTAVISVPLMVVAASASMPVVPLLIRPPRIWAFGLAVRTPLFDTRRSPGRAAPRRWCRRPARSPSWPPVTFTAVAVKPVAPRSTRTPDWLSLIRTSRRSTCLPPTETPVWVRSMVDPDRASPSVVFSITIPRPPPLIRSWPRVTLAAADVGQHADRLVDRGEVGHHRAVVAGQLQATDPVGLGDHARDLRGLLAHHRQPELAVAGGADAGDRPRRARPADLHPVVAVALGAHPDQGGALVALQHQAVRRRLGDREALQPHAGRAVEPHAGAVAQHGGAHQRSGAAGAEREARTVLRIGGRGAEIAEGRVRGVQPAGRRPRARTAGPGPAATGCPDAGSTEVTVTSCTFSRPLPV